MNHFRTLFPVQLIFLLLLIVSCKEKDKTTPTAAECEKFKKGSFFYKGEDPTLYKIERSDTIQTEFLGNNREFANFSIKWTSPCTYELQFLNQHLERADSVPAAFKQVTVKVDINKVQNDTCFVTWNVGDRKGTGMLYVNDK